MLHILPIAITHDYCDILITVNTHIFLLILWNIEFGTNMS